MPLDTVLTEEESWTCNKCLDYIFVLVPVEEDKESAEKFIDYESF